MQTTQYSIWCSTSLYYKYKTYASGPWAAQDKSSPPLSRIPPASSSVPVRDGQSIFLFFGRCCQPIAKQTRRVKMTPIDEKQLLMLFRSIRKQKTRARNIRIWVHPIHGIGVKKVLFNISFDGMCCIVKNKRLGSWYNSVYALTTT